MVKASDLLNIRYYDYGQAFFGSYKGIRYRIAREPLINVSHTPNDKRGGEQLKLSLWKEPFSFEKTNQELIKENYFEYSNEGLSLIAEYLSTLKQL